MAVHAVCAIGRQAVEFGGHDVVAVAVCMVALAQPAPPPLNELLCRWLTQFGPSQAPLSRTVVTA